MKGFWLGVAGLGIAMAIAWACGSQSSHVFIARPYEIARDCVDPSAGVDVVDGPPSTASCAPVCVIDTMHNYLVTGSCPPYPYGDAIQAMDAAVDPTCMLALAAYVRNDTCYPDGGSSNPIGADGGEIEAGGNDTGTDAPCPDGGP